MSSPILDITLVESYNNFFLAIGDISTYPTNYTITSPTLEITPPGFNKISVVFSPKNVNYYKSDQIGITCGEENECVPLIDGIYTLKYSIHPSDKYFVEKQFMRVNGIRNEYSKAFLKVDLMDCSSLNKKKDKAYLRNIAILIDGAVAETNNCDVDLAYKYYKKAKQLLDNFYKSECNCL